MIDRHFLTPFVLALVAFAITIGAAMAFAASVAGEGQAMRASEAALPATPTGNPPSPTAAPGSSPVSERSQSGSTRGSAIRMMVMSAASESQEVGRAVHHLLTPSASD